MNAKTVCAAWAVCVLTAACGDTSPPSPDAQSGEDHPVVTDTAVDSPTADSTIDVAITDSATDVITDVTVDVTADVTSDASDVSDVSDASMVTDVVDAACGAGQTTCGGACVTLASDTRNCGACGNACPSGQSCVSGACAVVCDMGRVACPVGASLLCVDVQTDENHCGTCDVRCPSDQSCSGGRCVCATGQRLCSGACVDTQTDAINCGSCGVRCPTGQFCRSGRCSITCDAPRASCGSGASLVCVDTSSNLEHCGACDRPCVAPANATATCASGACGFTCATGFADCDGSAANGCEVDLRASTSSCGVCGRACSSGQSCVAGVCSSNCGNGRVDVGETCDTAIAAGATGACPASCSPSTMTCTTVSLARAGTCAAACESSPIIVCLNGDGCCVSGCNSTNDNDCAPRCGNGVVEAGETCDTSIAAGFTGACPTSCAPTATCTTASVTNGGTCTATCTSAPSTACVSGDGCCPSGCTMARDSDCGPCSDECVLGARRCGTGGVQTCALTDGCYLWSAPVACASGQTCVSGRCAGASRTISTSTELCGEQWFTGDVVIQGGARVTCATGYLEIHARSISVDPASSIVMASVGVGPQGGGGSTSNSYLCSGSSTSVVCAGGGGGGGGAGSGSPGLTYHTQCEFGGICYSYGYAGGGTALDSRPYDDGSSMGASGGAGCPTCTTAFGCNSAGGRGGGLIRLIATNNILIEGSLQAPATDGAGASATRSSGAGGGGGGTVLLRAPDVELTATSSVQARGGAGGTVPSAGYCTGSLTDSPNGGAGGGGVLKVLTATRYVNLSTRDSGTSLRAGFMPPTLASNTHPNQNRYYNDGFSAFNVSWTAPVAGLPGYLTAMNDVAYPPLTSMNGTFTTATSASFPASRFLATGEYFFTVASIDASATPSPMLSAWRVRVNAAPPTLASISHPTQTSWYTGRTVVVSWTLPAGVPSSDFNGRMWYRVDHVSNTAPGRTAEGWTRTTAPSLSLTTGAGGAPLTDGVWYVHLAAEDTMGYLTRTAGHYRVQLGTEPARTNFFGYVENSAGVRQTGVTVTLEPLALTATTDASGYFIFSSIYAGTYQMTVSRSGTTLGTTSITTASAPFTFRLP